MASSISSMNCSHVSYLKIIREFEDRICLGLFVLFFPSNEFKINLVNNGLYNFEYILCKNCLDLKNNKVHQ